jgi:hypothetical protein
MSEPEKVTDEQAVQALHQLAGLESEPEAATVVTPAEPAAAVEAAPAAPAPEPEVTAEATPEPESDDVESLKKRLADKDAEIQAVNKRATERAEAIQRRYAANEQILRDRLLRKSTVADKAHKILKASRTESGVPEAEVDGVIREIEGTMNPASASYSPPSASAEVPEDQAMVLNNFLNEKGISGEEEAEFGKWMRGDAATALSEAEQNVARRGDVDGFLRIAYPRFLEGQREKDKQQRRDDAVEAARSVQRTQREAARAASPTAAAPRKQPAAQQQEVDVKKLTKEDISSLVKQSFEQYR